MLVKDLIAVLQQCDPYAGVKIDMPEIELDLNFGTPNIDELENCYEAGLVKIADIRHSCHGEVELIPQEKESNP